MQINENYLKLQAGYLFPEISRRVHEFSGANPDAQIIKLGIGDVTEPLPDACVQAMHKAIDDQANRPTFHGYGPEQGYPWLREKIVEYDFKPRGCDIDADEVFISDGSKCDTGNILDILGPNNTVAVTDPVYPVYVDTNVMVGHTGPANPEGQYEGLVYLQATAMNDFLPEPPNESVDVVYLCSPNNPTGAVMPLGHLENWVDYARRHGALILFDAAYEAYITEENLPHSIYEVAGAEQVAIEFRSFSKLAGFTGVRCAYTVVPKALETHTHTGKDVSLHQLWLRRQNTMFNGVSYISQRGAEAVYSKDGQKQVRKLVEFYLENARLIRQALTKAGLTVHGGENSPYVWIKTPESTSSWDLFDKLLENAHVVGTPGSGFGSAGEGYFRLSAFNSRDNVHQAMDRVTHHLNG